MLKRFNRSSSNERYARDSVSSLTTYFGEIPLESLPKTDAPNAGVVSEIGDFRQMSNYISETVQDGDTATTED